MPYNSQHLIWSSKSKSIREWDKKSLVFLCKKIIWAMKSK